MTALITGAGGLVGSECVRYFAPQFSKIIGIENNSRQTYFGPDASILNNLVNLQTITNFQSHPLDIRDYESLETIFKENDIKLIIHTAAQPSHDLAAAMPLTDFSVNALATLHLLELTRIYAPSSTFIFTSTNKVYGDFPNHLEYEESSTRYTPVNYPYGFDESTKIDDSLHTLFGVSKLSADLLVQEYNKCFGLKTGVFRLGCITGTQHCGVKLHGFLSYLVKCLVNSKPYTIIGYGGKQVRDHIHVADLVEAFGHFYLNPVSGVYNLGGGASNCSVIEAIAICEEAAQKRFVLNYEAVPRVGDHKWWVSNTAKFQMTYPAWTPKYNIHQIAKEMVEYDLSHCSQLYIKGR